MIRQTFDHSERTLGAAFPAAWNPLLNLGALGFFFFWIVAASGVYVYIFFDTGVATAFESVEYMTNDQWYAAGIMRSFHRYASDGLVVVMLLHLLREFGLGRYRGVRWFSWTTGVPVLVLMYAAGITGYWLVWDKLAQYVAIVSSEWLDQLPFFGQPIARNFLSPVDLESRFFTLMMFMHIAVPLIALGLLWLHLQRIAKPRINPPLGLCLGVGMSLLAMAIVKPALSQGPANLATVPGAIGLDWFYLPAYPLIETLPGRATWTSAFGMLAILVAFPWLPPMRKASVAVVNLDNCNGCRRCEADCPYNAITMQQRSDGRPFAAEAVVDPSLCVDCGICAGACPTSTPFRRMTALVPGIDLADRQLAAVRADLEAEGARLVGSSRIMVFGCLNAGIAESHRGPDIGVVSINCAGHLPPSFVEYVLSRQLADGVIVLGCRENSCMNRFGQAWTSARLAGERDPRLRGRIPRDRIRAVWAGRIGNSQLSHEILALRRLLAEAAPEPPRMVRTITARQKGMTGA
ncbi:MAG: cytochrome b N-terminal domain-containing protein [Hyphomicrobiales bacterium]